MLNFSDHKQKLQILLEHLNISKQKTLIVLTFLFSNHPIQSDMSLHGQSTSTTTWERF